ncbi:DNA-binding transcriptional regulator, LysR family [Jatrophihabitans endophyticus]|uniref:DNA-binding transcriptional regulator, LysR family n=1 Tax=Jatrophihabitans endophyticus TaxID=1206085 RepID=A0A1M5DQ05_9ACTN|nr:LysR family transcriptional regulator [Jatrophihabitans endophyticus]SHF69053.1 DNA-binding transcriptional regulator, LysR family [Jatrophihabitans endophyticus]
MPSLRALQCFTAVAEHDTVTAAAVHLGITQPALSHQITALERELGVAVLDRQQRGSRLTPAGRALLPYALTCVDAEHAFTEQARRVAGLRIGELRVCCAQSVTAGLLPRVLRHWQRRHPDVTIFVSEFDSADRVAAAVRAGDADLGVAPTPSAWDGRTTTLGWEEMVVAMAVNDPLASSASVPLTRLADRGLVHFTSGHALSGWVDATFAAAGLHSRVVVRTGQTSAAALLAATGIGPALVPLTALPPRYPGVVRPLRPKRGRDIVALTATDDPLTMTFVADLVANGVPTLPRTRTA